MIIALAVYKNRIASLFDSSDRFIIFQSKDDEQTDLKTLLIAGKTTYQMISMLRKNSVETLICGAICGRTHHLLEANQINVIPWITGSVENVLHACKNDNLLTTTFLMPGCRGKKRRGHRFQGGNLY